jgi:hypothetical protein
MGGARLSDGSCDSSLEAKYEARLLCAWLGADGVSATSVISSPDSDPGPGERTCGGGGGTGRAMLCQYKLGYRKSMTYTLMAPEEVQDVLEIVRTTSMR